MNFFVGANNAGKSIVLRLIKDHLPLDEGEKIADTADVYRGGSEGKLNSFLGVKEQTYSQHLKICLQKRYAATQRTCKRTLKTRGAFEKVASEIAKQLTFFGGIWVNPASQPQLLRLNQTKKNKT